MAKEDTKKAGASTPPAATKQTNAGKVVPALRVTAKRDGFRRGGRAWNKEATVVPLSDLSKDQLAQIKGESLLTVEEIEIDGE